MDSPTPAVETSPSPPTPAVAGMSLAERIGHVADWILAGMRASALASEWARAGWGNLEPGEVRNILAAAQNLIRADAEIRPALEEQKQFVRLNNLYASALEIQDHKTALRVHREITIAIAKAKAAADLAD